MIAFYYGILQQLQLNDDEVAMRENRIALERIKLKPRVLVDGAHAPIEVPLPHRNLEARDGHRV